MKKEVKAIILISLVLAVFSLVLFSSASFVSSQSGDTTVNFSTGGVRCNSGASNAAWENLSSNIITNVVVNGQDVGNCSLYYIPNYIHSCCSADNLCNFTTGRCYYWPISQCYHYPDQHTCNEAPASIGAASVGNSTNCGINSPNFIYHNTGSPFDHLLCTNSTTCRCVWDSATSNCTAVKAFPMNCENSSNTDTGNSRMDTGQCLYRVAVLQDNCNTTRTITIKSTATWIKGTPNNAEAELGCQNITRTYPCTATAALDFWTDAGIALVIVILVGIYIYLVLKRKKTEIKPTASPRHTKKKR